MNMRKQQTDMGEAFKTLAVVFLLGGLAALIGAGTIVPLLLSGLALAVLVKVFRRLEAA